MPLPRALYCLHTHSNPSPKLKPLHLQWLKEALTVRNYEFVDDYSQNSMYTISGTYLGRAPEKIDEK